MRLGEYDKNSEIDCDKSDPDDVVCAEPVKDVAVASFQAHTEFDLKTKYNDIGLVKLSEAANFKSRSIKPLCLPFKNAMNTMPSHLIVIGWGRKANDQSKDNGILQKATLPFYESEKCKKVFNDYYAKNNFHSDFTLSDTQFCAGGDGILIY